MDRLFLRFIAILSFFVSISGFSMASEVKPDFKDGLLGEKTAAVKEFSVSDQAERMFWNRNWKALTELVSSENVPDARTLSLAANGLWQQKKWKESLELMTKVGDKYPPSIAPYADLLKVLALERTGRTQDAYTSALTLYKSSEKFPLVRYYSMYTMFRLTSSMEEKEKWLRRMYSSPKSNRALCLRELAGIGRMSPKDSLELLKISPQNREALKAVENAPDSPEKFYRLGYSAYLRGDNETAVKWLSRIKLSGPFGEAGTYYCGYSLQRLGRSVEAEPLFVSLVYKKDTDYMIRSMFRLRLMFGGKAHEAALSDLLKMTESGNAEIAHQALYSLAVSRWEKAGEAVNEYLKKYPDGSHFSELSWTKGWESYKNGNYAEALSAWGKSKKRSPQFLYWMSKANGKLGNKEKELSLREDLLKSFPISLYAFMAEPHGAFEVVESSWPEALFTPLGELEKWGFVSHAQMELEEKKDIVSSIRRARISMWLGNDWQVFKELRGFAENMISGHELPLCLMKLLYPRPFKAIVEEQSAKYGVDPLFIWATMRLESGFNPGASNWIGANGLMQMMPGTASGEAKKMGLKSYNLFNPKDSISMAASHISGLMSKFGENMRCVSGAYNAGAGAVKSWNDKRGNWDDDMWIESIPFAETNGYVKTVMLNYYIYKKLYGNEYKKGDVSAE